MPSLWLWLCAVACAVAAVQGHKVAWFQIAPGSVSPSARWGHGMAAANGTVFMFGGQSGRFEAAYRQYWTDLDAILFDDLWSYDDNATEWRSLEPLGQLPQGRWGHSIVAIGHVLWMCGGVDLAGVPASAKTPNPHRTPASRHTSLALILTTGWESTLCLPSSQLKPCQFLLSRTLPLIAHQPLPLTDTTDLTACWLLARLAAQLACLRCPAGLSEHRALIQSFRGSVGVSSDAISERGYMTRLTFTEGIFAVGNVFNELWMLDVADKYLPVWLQHPASNMARFDHGMTAVGGVLYVFGGRISVPALDPSMTEDYEFDVWQSSNISYLDTNDHSVTNWSTLEVANHSAEAPEPRASAGMMAVGQKIYLMGGDAGPDAWWVNWLWDQDDAVWMLDVSTSSLEWRTISPVKSAKTEYLRLNGRRFFALALVDDTLQIYGGTYNPWDFGMSLPDSIAPGALIKWNTSSFSLEVEEPESGYFVYPETFDTSGRQAAYLGGGKLLLFGGFYYGSALRNTYVWGCARGHYSVQDRCNICPPGTYSSGAANSCTKCEYGFFAEVSGAHSCRSGAPLSWKEQSRTVQPQGRQAHGMAVVDGVAYVFGGHTGYPGNAQPNLPIHEFFWRFYKPQSSSEYEWERCSVTGDAPDEQTLVSYAGSSTALVAVDTALFFVGTKGNGFNVWSMNTSTAPILVGVKQTSFSSQPGNHYWGSIEWPGSFDLVSIGNILWILDGSAGCGTATAPLSVLTLDTTSFSSSTSWNTVEVGGTAPEKNSGCDASADAVTVVGQRIFAFFTTYSAADVGYKSTVFVLDTSLNPPTWSSFLTQRAPRESLGPIQATTLGTSVYVHLQTIRDENTHNTFRLDTEASIPAWEEINPPDGSISAPAANGGAFVHLGGGTLMIYGGLLDHGHLYDPTTSSYPWSGTWFLSCVKGSYFDQSTCSSCAAGTFSGLEGATSCTQCHSMDSALRCPVGEFQKPCSPVTGESAGGCQPVHRWGTDNTWKYCVLKMTLKELATAAVRNQLVVRTGGLGPLQEKGKHDTWVCVKQHACSAAGQYFCFVYDILPSVFVPWGRMEDIGLGNGTCS